MEYEQGDDKLTLYQRMARVEVLVEQIKDNHLVHLGGDLKDLNTKVNWLLYLIITTLTAVVINFLKP